MTSSRRHFLTGVLAVVLSACTQAVKSVAEWRRKHDGDERAWVPEGVLHAHWYPQDTQQVMEIMQKNRGPKVRVAGSGWALSAAVCDRDYKGDLIETHGLNRAYQDVIPTCLTPAVANDLARQAEYNLIHVGAGMRIYELYSWLDGNPGPDTPEHYGPPPNHKGLRWALPTMGGAGGQTIVGAFSTSTHGGDQNLPPIADAVVAIELVTGDGTRYWLQRGRFSDRVAAPLCDAAKLPGMKVVSDDNALRAAMVAVGRMGVIVSVVLRVVPAFGLKQWRWDDTWSNAKKLLLQPNQKPDLYRHRFLQVVVNPLPRLLQTEHSCWIENRDEVSLDASKEWPGRTERTGPMAGRNTPIFTPTGDLYSTACSQPNYDDALDTIARALDKSAGQKFERAALDALGGLLSPAWAIQSTVETIDASACKLAAEAVRGLRGARFTNLADLLAELVNALVRAGQGWALTLVEDAFIGFGQPTIPEDNPRVAHSYAVMDFYNYSDKVCVANGNSIEIAVGGATARECSAAAIKFVEESIFKGAKDVTNDHMAFGAYCSLRWTRGTDALLGIQQWPYTCIIEIAGLKHFNGLTRLLDGIVRDAVNSGSTIHWGQWNDPLTKADVEHAYHRTLPTWRKWLSEFDPDGTFSTEFSRHTGLEPA